MSGLANNFIKDPVVLPIGSVKHTVLVSNNSTGVADTNILYENGVWIPQNAVYSQSTYPELYSQLGLINASVFTPRVSGVSTGTFGQTINNLVYGNGQYVASSEGTWLTSTDGVTWVNKSSGSSTDIGSIVYGNSIFITTLSNDTLRTTTNFLNWTSFTPGQGTVRAINYLNGTYFLSTINGIYTSTNLASWTQRSSGDASSIFYGNGIYMAHRPNYNISTSTDGISWTSQTSPGIFFSLTYGNGTFLVTGFSGMVATSTNGVAWTQQTSGSGSGFGLAAYQNGIFFINGQGILRTSTDNGVTWTARSYSGDVGYAITYGNGVYIITARGGNASAGPVGSLNTSTDGFTWTVRNAGVSLFHPFGLLYQNGTYYVAGSYGIIKTSTNGTVWPLTFLEMIYDNGLYMHGGYDGVIGTSTDATTWTIQTSGTTSTITALTYGNGTYIFATTNGGISTSTNLGVTWSSRTSGTTSTINALTYGNGRFVYAGNGGVVRTSTNDNGVTWTAVTSGTTSTIFALAYGNGLYAYAGVGGVLASSTDAITWTARTSGTTSTINALVYQNGIFSYATVNGGIGTSTDGITWIPKVSGTTSTINALTYGNGLYVSGGFGGYLSTATNIQTLNFASYDVTTQFFVPALTGQGTFGTVTFGSQPSQKTFIKAKN